ncbi:MAG: HD domain-containing protein [Proteocatella sp.]
MDNNIHRAVELAALSHDGQFRKGTKIPYITHPFEVAQMLTSYGCREDVIIAGLLHDTVEDTPLTLDLIDTGFGAEVCRFVKNCTEDKTKSWKERKQHTIDFLADCNELEMLILSCADKTSNLRSIKEDYDEIGDRVWERFKASKEQISWYYRKLNDIFKVLNEHEVYLENTRLYQYIFYS